MEQLSAPLCLAVLGFCSSFNQLEEPSLAISYITRSTPSSFSSARLFSVTCWVDLASSSLLLVLHMFSTQPRQNQHFSHGFPSCPAPYERYRANILSSRQTKIIFIFFSPFFFLFDWRATNWCHHGGWAKLRGVESARGEVDAIVLLRPANCPWTHRSAISVSASTTSQLWREGGRTVWRALWQLTYAKQMRLEAKLLF